MEGVLHEDGIRQHKLIVPRACLCRFLDLAQPGMLLYRVVETVPHCVGSINDFLLTACVFGAFDVLADVSRTNRSRRNRQLSHPPGTHTNCWCRQSCFNPPPDPPNRQNQKKKENAASGWQTEQLTLVASPRPHPIPVLITSLPIAPRSVGTYCVVQMRHGEGYWLVRMIPKLHWRRMVSSACEHEALAVIVFTLAAPEAPYDLSNSFINALEEFHLWSTRSPNGRKLYTVRGDLTLASYLASGMQ